MKAEDQVRIEEKLFLVKFRHGPESHLTITERQVCLDCPGKWCTTICPAKVYDWDEGQKKIVVNWENCLETGACITGCPYANIIFKYPKGGRGVEYRFG